LTVEEDNVESIFSRIDEMRAALRDEYGPDAEGLITQIDRDIELQLQKDPLLMYASDLFYRAGIALRRARIDTARRLQSNGVQENLALLDARMYGGRTLDAFIAGLQPGEKLLPGGEGVKWWSLTTNLRTVSRAELKRAARTAAEIDDHLFEQHFEPSDVAVRQGEAAEAERNNPTAPQYGRQLSYPNGIRPGR
jgi:hypothetical protein